MKEGYLQSDGFKITREKEKKVKKKKDRNLCLDSLSPNLIKSYQISGMTLQNTVQGKTSQESIFFLLFSWLLHTLSSHTNFILLILQHSWKISDNLVRLSRLQLL